MCTNNCLFDMNKNRIHVLSFTSEALSAQRSKNAFLVYSPINLEKIFLKHNVKYKQYPINKTNK